MDKHKAPAFHDERSNGRNGWHGRSLTHLASFNGPVLWNSDKRTIENSTFVARRAVMGNGSLNNFISNNNVLAIFAGGNSGYELMVVHPETYTGDHNVFYRDKKGEVYIEDASTSTIYTTLSGWQNASGQDQNSVYLTDAQYENFFLGDPSQGDFRINPNAEVTAADGTVYTGEFPDGTPITDAGPQTHWDWNTRQAVDGAPTEWPTPPDTLEESKDYVADPEAWDFYSN